MKLSDPVNNRLTKGFYHKGRQIFKYDEEFINRLHQVIRRKIHRPRHQVVERRMRLTSSVLRGIDFKVRTEGVGAVCGFLEGF